MNIKESVGKLDKIAFMKALGLVCLSWLALPILYYMFKKKEIKEDDGEE